MTGVLLETISHALREKDYAAIPRIFSLYVNPGSAAEAGLRNRRRAEGKLWGYPTGSVLLKVAYETQVQPYDIKKGTLH